jgi:hypothetical protein
MPILYVLNAEGTDLYKIGVTALTVEGRIKQLQTGCPFFLRTALVFELPTVTEAEGVLHNRFQGQRMSGEWFRLTHEDLCEIETRNFLANIPPAPPEPDPPKEFALPRRGSGAASHVIDGHIATLYGIPEAVLVSHLLYEMRQYIIWKETIFNIGGEQRHWSRIPNDRCRAGFFPFWTSDQYQEIIRSLAEQNVIEVLGGLYSFVDESILGKEVGQ